MKLKTFVLVGQRYSYGEFDGDSEIINVNIATVKARGFANAAAMLGAKISGKRKDNEAEIDFNYEELAKRKEWKKEEREGMIEFTRKGFRGFELPVFFDATTKQPKNWIAHRERVTYHLQCLPEFTS